MKNLVRVGIVGACGATLAACVSVQMYTPPPTATGTATVEVRKPLGFGGGDRMSVFAFDNADCVITAHSGFLAALDVTTPSASRISVAADRRIYLRGLSQVSSVSVMPGQGVQQQTAPCADLVSFEPEVDASYIISRIDGASGCETVVLDTATHQSPATLQHHEMGAACRSFTGISED